MAGEPTVGPVGRRGRPAPYARATGIVDDLLASPGVYVGTDKGVGNDYVGAARIVVAPLPGGAGGARHRR